MKISDAWIYDPAKLGEIAVPELCVEVDEEPSVTIEPETFANGWTVGKYGPFVKYSHSGGSRTAVDFNLAFRDRFPMVIDITLAVTPDPEDNERTEVIFDTYSLPLTRARQLVKKYAPEWRLLISDREAIHGNLVWRPVQTDPECRGEGGFCGIRPATAVRIKGVDIPLCYTHLKEHNSVQAQARTLTSK
jgi:hypothetical protein